MHLSFSVARGSFFSILGPSGCGKTTLLRMIAGFIAPDNGRDRIGGRSMGGVAPNRRPVNMVFQQLALFPMMSVGENVAFGLARRGVARAERTRKAAAMLERVGLGGAGGKRVDELSGGQRQRVAIARSLVLEPTLLLLDEPLGALDLKLREHMKIELKQLQSAFGTTFVYITHDQSEALVLSDHVGGHEPRPLRAARHAAAALLRAGNRRSWPPSSAPTTASPARRRRSTATSRSSQTPRAGRCARAESGAIGAGRRRRGIRAARGRHDRSATPRELPPDRRTDEGEVESLLFDGANSAVLLQEDSTRVEFRVALPQTGRYADLKVGETVVLQLRSAARGLLCGHGGRMPEPAAPRWHRRLMLGCCWRRR